jgi:hypothetical protein
MQAPPPISATVQLKKALLRTSTAELASLT